MPVYMLDDPEYPGTLGDHLGGVADYMLRNGYSVLTPEGHRGADWRVCALDGWLYTCLTRPDRADSSDGEHVYVTVAATTIRRELAMRPRLVTQCLAVLEDYGTIALVSRTGGVIVLRHILAENIYRKFHELALSTLRRKDLDAAPTPAKPPKQLVARYKATCVYCKKVGTPELGPDGRSWHRDHVHAKVAGGKDGASNIVLACATCNWRKHSTSAGDFLAKLAEERDATQTD